MNPILSISVIIPTLNSAKTLRLCLDSIAMQDYPQEAVEVIFADGGSKDDTLEIIEGFRKNNEKLRIKVVMNKLKTGEAGKVAALKAAGGDVAAFIDSDNVLDSSEWLARMIEPFRDQDTIASEPVRYTYRRQDGFITRYCALMGMNDPLCYFLGNYDRECVLSGTWTNMPYETLEDTGSYLKLKLDPNKMPTMGANGFLIRKPILDDAIADSSYLFDIDLLTKALLGDPSRSVAKVKNGIIHIFAGSLGDFYRKQKRRICDYRFHKAHHERSYQWNQVNKKGLWGFCLSCVFVLPLFYQALKGYFKTKDACWLAHPIFCLATFFIYARGYLQPCKADDRSSWQAPKTYGKR